MPANKIKSAAKAVLMELHRVEIGLLDEAGKPDEALETRLRTSAVQKALKEALGIDDTGVTKKVLAVIPGWDPFKPWDASDRAAVADILQLSTAA